MLKNSENIKFLKNWHIVASSEVGNEVQELSKVDVDLEPWHDAKVPSTVLGTLVNNGIYKDPYFGMNLKEIPTKQFEQPWIYRTEFDIDEIELSKIAILQINGINYKANIWLNGVQVIDESILYGAYRQFQFDVSSFLNQGKNILVVEVIPPKPGDFTIGFVDWNPSPPDKNLGIFREVYLKFNGGVSIENPFIESELNISRDRAALTITSNIKNYSQKEISGILKAKIEEIIITSELSIAPNETRQVSFYSDENLQLIFEKPRLWWPNNLGKPNLYELELEFISDLKILDSTQIKFGIREVEDYINEEGHRGYKINGHKVLIKGAGWADDLLLQDTHESIKTQIEYVKHMNLNCIRLEGFWGKDQAIYNLCDEYGILIMVGWSCQWEHEGYLGKPIDTRYGGVLEPDEINLVAKSWEDQLLWLRHHPSIFVWTVGSDMVPHPDLEKRYIMTFREYDNTRPYLNSTGGAGSEQGIITTTEIISEISGSSRVKMLGPYDYTPPVYWFTNQNLGGAYGFNTETCPGANVQPIDSIKNIIPAEHLWPVDEFWNYHCGTNEFNSLDLFRKSLTKRYGEPANVEEFTMKAQVMNYELMRPMFEAFQSNKGRATGIIQWMLNSAWPEMYWQLYGHDLLPNGAFYGTKSACKPIHILYNYGERSVEINNDTFSDLKNYSAKVSLFDINSKCIYSDTHDVNVKSESKDSLIYIPLLDELSETYFLDLKLYDGYSKEVDRNFYWLSKKDDVLDYEAKFESWAYYTPSKEYADLSLLNSIPEVKLNFSSKIINSDKKMMEVSLVNNNKSIAFCIELQFIDKVSKEVILPVLWEDNYISILPNEDRRVKAEILNDIPIYGIELRVKGWNLISSTERFQSN